MKTPRNYKSISCFDCGCELSVRTDQIKDENRCRSCGARNKWANKVYRDHQTQSHVGKKLTADHCAKISQALKGKMTANILSLHEARTKKFGVAAMNSYYAAYRNQAKKRNKVFSLGFNDFESIVTAPCAFCGSPPSVVKQPHPSVNGHVIVNGIDRLDSKIGYVLSNCVSCCKACNYAKQQMTVDEFASWVRRISQHLEIGGWDTVGSRQIFTK
jgi:DNA-directed RNA polymerase subunit M/transcription elongation factor TFIIS